MKRNVVILRPAVKDKFGDSTGPETEILESDWIIAMNASRDDQEGTRNSVNSSATAYVPYSTKARHFDRVSVDGDVWQVAGDPQRWESPFTGYQAGATVALEKHVG